MPYGDPFGIQPEPQDKAIRAILENLRGAYFEIVALKKRVQALEDDANNGPARMSPSRDSYK